METRTLCPNCGHEKYIALKVTSEFGTLKLESILEGEGLDIDMQRVNRIFFPETTLEYDVQKLPKVTVLTPKMKARKADKSGQSPHECPDCGNKLVTEGKNKSQLLSHKPLGFLSLALLIQHKDDAAFRASIFPDVQHVLKVQRRGNVIRIAPVLDAPAEEIEPPPPTTPGQGTVLNQIREAALMEGIDGAESMTIEQIAAARKSMKKAGREPAKV